MDQIESLFTQFDHYVPYTSLISLYPAIIGPIIYLCLVGIGYQIMKNKKPFDLRIAMANHNLFLFILSAIMCLGSLIEIILTYSNYEFLDAFCSCNDSPSNFGLGGAALFWAYLFYISKYYEFADTLFIVLRKKNLVFLHYYHHAIVAMLSLSFIRANMFFFMNGVFVNSFIHTLMYWSYYKSALGQPPKWKRYLTMLQIVQFFWGLACFLPWPYICGYGYFDMKEPIIVFWFNQIVLISFFVLFILFYNERYEPKTSTEKKTE